MPKQIPDPWNYNNQWNYYQAQKPSDPAQPPNMQQPTRYSDKAFLHTWIAGALLPLLQAVITSVVIMLGTACFVWLINGYDYVKPVLSAGMATLIVTWLALQFRWINLSKLEEWTGLELDGRPGIGPQLATQKASVRVQVDEVTDQGHLKVSEVYDLPATPAQLKALCIGLHDLGMSLAETDWAPLEAGKPFSLPQIRSLKKEMLDRNIIVYVNAKNKSLGFTETVVGRRIIESWRKFEEDVSPWGF